MTPNGFIPEATTIWLVHSPILNEHMGLFSSVPMRYPAACSFDLRVRKCGGDVRLRRIGGVGGNSADITRVSFWVVVLEVGSKARKPWVGGISGMDLDLAPPCSIETTKPNQGGEADPQHQRAGGHREPLMLAA